MSEINRRNLVERFRDEYSAKFSTLVRERFATLVADAQVDVAANRQTVAEVKAMDSLSSVLGGRKSVCTGLMMLGFLFAISAVFGLLYQRASPTGDTLDNALPSTSNPEGATSRHDSEQDQFRESVASDVTTRRLDDSESLFPYPDYCGL